MSETTVTINEENPIPTQTPEPAPVAAQPAGTEEPQPVDWSDPAAALAASGVEKFQSYEALVDAYKALEARLSGAPTAPPLEPGPAEGEIPGLTPEVFTAAQAAASQNGGYSEATRAQLLAIGVPKGILDFTEQAIEGMGQLYTHQLVAEVGSPTDFAQMQVWAENALDPESLEAFKTAVKSGDVQVAVPYVKGVAARWRESTSEPGHQIEGMETGPTVQPFRSQAEMVAAMEDPRYGLGNTVKMDPAYKADVVARIAAGKQAGYF